MSEHYVEQEQRPGRRPAFHRQTSLIASGAELVGDMNLKGAVQIDGTVRGALQAHEGLVRVSAGGRVDGEIRAPM